MEGKATRGQSVPPIMSETHQTPLRKISFFYFLGGNITREIPLVQATANGNPPQVKLGQRALTTTGRLTMSLGVVRTLLAEVNLRKMEVS